MPKLIHTMVRVRDLQTSIDFYSQAFGFNEKHRLDFPTFTLVYLGNDESEAELELTFNKDRETNYDLGDAYGHIAFSVDNLSESYEHIKGHNFNPTDIFELTSGDISAKFFFVTDPDGYQIEVLARGGHYK